MVSFFYAALRLYFVPHAISIEKLDCFKAVKLSLQLTKRKVSHIIWPIFFCYVFVALLPSAAQSLISYLPFNDPLVNRIIAALTIAASGLLFPFKYINSTQLYIYLKNQKGMIDFRYKLYDLVKNESEKITFGQPNEVVK